MSQQDENQVLAPQELREALLSELETNRQELAELNDEQLAEIVGGVLSGDEIKEICCMAGFAAGSALGAFAGHHVGGLNGGMPGMLIGGIAGSAVGATAAKAQTALKLFRGSANSTEETAALRPHDSLAHWARDLEAGPSH